MSKSKRTTHSGVFMLIYTKMSLTVAHLFCVTASDALLFVDFKKYFYQSYY
jgi:hypothetical protein